MVVGVEATHSPDDIFDYNDCIILDTYDDKRVTRLDNDITERMGRATQLTNFDPLTRADMELTVFKKVTSISFVLTFDNNFGLLRYVPTRVTVLQFDCCLSLLDHQTVKQIAGISLLDLQTVNQIAKKTVNISADYRDTIHSDWRVPNYIHIKQLFNFDPRTPYQLALGDYPEVTSVKFGNSFYNHEWFQKYKHFPARVTEVTLGCSFELKHLEPFRNQNTVTMLGFSETFNDELKADLFWPVLQTLRLNVVYPRSIATSALPEELKVLQFMPQRMDRMTKEAQRNRHFVGFDANNDKKNGSNSNGNRTCVLTPNIHSLVLDLNDTLGDHIKYNSDKITVDRHDLHPAQRLEERKLELRSKNMDLSRVIVKDDKNYRILPFFRGNNIVHAKKALQKKLVTEYENIMHKIGTYKTLAKKADASITAAKQQAKERKVKNKKATKKQAKETKKRG